MKFSYVISPSGFTSQRGCLLVLGLAILSVASPRSVVASDPPAAAKFCEEKIKPADRKSNPYCSEYCKKGGDCPDIKPQYPNDGKVVR